MWHCRIQSCKFTNFCVLKMPNFSQIFQFAWKIKFGKNFCPTLEVLKHIWDILTKLFQEYYLGNIWEHFMLMKSVSKMLKNKGLGKFILNIFLAWTNWTVNITELSNHTIYYNTPRLHKLNIAEASPTFYFTSNLFQAPQKWPESNHRTERNEGLLYTFIMRQDTLRQNNRWNIFNILFVKSWTASDPNYKDSNFCPWIQNMNWFS